MSNYNYITEKLLIRVNDVKTQLSSKTMQFLNDTVDKIISELNKYNGIESLLKKYNQLIPSEYTLKHDLHIILKNEDVKQIFHIDDDKLSKIQKHRLYNLTFNGEIVIINIYYDKDYDLAILDSNINKLMTRLWNLLTIFKNKGEIDPTSYTYNWYLYYNVKRANKNKIAKSKCGNLFINDIHTNYLKQLHDNICFNAQNGVTFHEEEFTSNISRLEESMGLLTHEFMHVIHLNDYVDPFKSKKNFNIQSKIEINEIFINFFASIFNVYLLSIETDKKSELKEMLYNEIIYSIINFVRLSKITGYDLEIIYDKNIYRNWEQQIGLYDYIVGKFLLYLNFNKINQDLLDNHFSITDNYNSKKSHNTELSLDAINNFHNQDDTILNIYNEFELINEDLSNSDPENDETCGNMIMQYFLYDPIQIEDKHKLPNLYGGKNTKLKKKSKITKKTKRLSKKLNKF